MLLPPEPRGLKGNLDKEILIRIYVPRKVEDPVKRQRVSVKVAQLCPILCDPIDCIVPEILQARVLKWVAFPFSRGSSQPRD